MKHLSLITILVFTFFLPGWAQPQDLQAQKETAKSFIRQGDYSNAILVINKALQQAPNDIDLLKDQVYTYYLSKDQDKAMKYGKALVDMPNADVQSYQMLGMVYKSIEEIKECEKLYKKGLKIFPNSGVLYNEYGELLGTKQPDNAIKQWEKGIEVDPNYASNYYNAAKYYYYSQPDKVWTILYGEIFTNLDSYSKRSTEMKNILLDSYKKLFTSQDMMKGNDVKNDFVKAYLESMSKQMSIASTSGIDVDALIMIRTRFLLDWYNTPNGTKYPFRLFEYHQLLLKSGLFEAYNQWLFGASQNLNAFQSWTTAHAQEYDKFTNFQRSRVFKVPENQSYQTK